MKKILTCKQLITWGGKVCYGKLFEIVHEQGATYAVCNKCQHKHEINQMKKGVN